ncbi:MAG TPA: bacillithiol system redox-active protein YtxJ [Pyrinomonadaceae bacterium]|nr:bacillithiol system redox-active protein YtxJ [Pyrinomonadaceae bacterium]
MGKGFNEVADAGALDGLVERSHEAPVLVFKHSTTCPISAAAYREMSQVGAAVALVVVQQARQLSNEIAQRTGVAHESPQALVLRNGKVVWSASHWRVTADEVERALRENA